MKNGEFKIEKGIIAPTRRMGGKVKYPFADMKVGDSFVARQVDGGSVRSSASAAGRRLKMTFSVGIQDDMSYRIWRTK